LANLPKKVAIYARVSTSDQQTISLQLDSMKSYLKERGWLLVKEVAEIQSGAVLRPKRDSLLKAARKREIDTIIVWKLDRWGRSLADLVVSLKELSDLGVGFISLTEALDFTTPAGRAMAGMLAIFAEFERDVLRERVRAGIEESRKKGTPHGRPKSASHKKQQVLVLYSQGYNKSQIAKLLAIGRTSVIRLLSS
jgi:DNA invertase Pin-like site-specific DNA recombinase